MRLLVTGGAGTLGSEFIRRYVGDDTIEVIFVLDTLATGSEASLPDGGKVVLRKGSIADPVYVDRIFEEAQPDAVLHAAASYANPEDWESDVTTNTLGMINVLRACSRVRVRRLVNLQTVLCYGNPERLPVREADPLRPSGSYAVSKVSAEQFAIQSDISTVSLRIGSVLSEGLAIGPVPAFYKNLREGKTCTVAESTRDFLDPEDFHPLLRRALNEGAPEGVFNVSSGQGHTMREVYELVSAHLGSESVPALHPVAQDDVEAIVLDSSKALREFGWKATVPFEDSVTRLLLWFDRHGVGAVRSHRREVRDGG